MNSRPKNRSNTEAHVLQVLESLLASEGVKGISISAVAKHAGVARSLLYRYFNNLDGLLSAYGNSRDLWPQLEEVLGMTELAFSQLPANKKFDRVMSGWSTALQQRPQTLAILAWALTERNALTDLIEVKLSALGTQCRQLLRSGKQAINENDTEYDFDTNWVIISAAKTFLSLRSQTQQHFGGMDIQNPNNQQRISDGFDYIFKAIAYYQQRPR